MTSGIRDGDRPALGHRHQCESLKARGIGDRFQVTDPGFEPVIGDIPVGEPVTALIEADHGGELAEVDKKVPPDRAFPVELQVAEPAGRDQQRRPVTVHGVGDSRAVGCPTEPHLLLRLG